MDFLFSFISKYFKSGANSIEHIRKISLFRPFRHLFLFHGRQTRGLEHTAKAKTIQHGFIVISVIIRPVAGGADGVELAKDRKAD